MNKTTFLSFLLFISFLSFATAIIPVDLSKTQLTKFDQIETAINSTSLILFVEITAPECAGEFGSIEVVGVEGGTPPYVFALDNDNFSSNMLFSNLLADQYLLKGKDVNGCETSLQIEITDPPQLIVEIGISGEGQYFQGTNIQAIAHRNIQQEPNFLWFVNGELFSNDEIITLQVWDSLDIELVAYDQNGCKATDEVFIEAIIRDIVFVPNVFSPNDDGINDQLIIWGRPEVVKQIIRFQVYHRRGDLVYELQNFPINTHYGWDGRIRNQFMSQVFAWVLEVELWDGTTQIFRGDVTPLK